ncbi:MAG: protein kinase [Sandaracinaceae bacterium]
MGSSCRPPLRRHASSGSHPSGLATGTVVGGRFEIERAVGEDALGAILAAKDQKTQRPISVRVLAPGLIATEDAVEILRRHVKVAAGTQHRNVVATYGMGTDKASGSRYVANEWVDGQTLAEVVASKAGTGAPMSLRGAYNVVAHVCRALEAVRGKGSCHGALRPTVVYVTKSGRVKVGNLGVDLAVVQAAGPAALGAGEQAFLAPEVKAGAHPDTRSDVFGIGGLLYAMLTGRSPLDDFVAPSEAHPEATPDLDAVLMRCLAADPAARYESPNELRDALVALATAHDEVPASHDEEDFGVDIDVDVDIGSVPPPGPDAPIAPPAAAAPRPSPPKPSPPRPSGAGPQVGQRVALDESFRKPVEAVVPAMSAEVDLSSLLSKITENDAPRWMVVKDNLDHGPFSGRELVNLILKGEVLAEHGLLNMDTGERRKVGEAPEFSEFCEQWKLKKKAADHAVALERSAKVEKASMATKALILGAVAAAVGIGVAIFLLTRPDVEETTRADADLADLYEAGEVEITGTAGLLPDPPANPNRPRRHGGGGRGGGSYEDAMNQVVNLGNANGTGSMARLSAAQVAGVMNANINRLVPCLSQGSGGGQVRIDIAIAGSGQVLGASVRNGTPGFQRCVAGRVRGIRFPSFAAPRMGASYTFSAN